MPKMLYLTESEVQKLLPMGACIEMMRRAFQELAAGTAINQPRRRLILPTGSVLHQMAGSFGKYFATKIYSSNRKHGGLHQVFVHLYDAETGRPLALLEANVLSEVRTGAATGYATDVLAAPDASVLAIIGSGLQARTQVEAVRAVRSLKEVRVWSPSPEHASRFAADMRCKLAESAEAAVRGTSIVVTATAAKNPVIEADWVAPGTLVNAVGSNMANRRELPAELVRAAGRVVVDNLEQARIEAGDLIVPDSWDNVVELKDVQPGYDPASITVFESQGIAVEDAAAAAYVYEQAVEKRVGRPLQ
jgi:ornithine cyclodeaminase/alanine dehydrogenase-like protein (mu-crystallin family)